MANTILLKRSSTTGSVPSANQLTLGELALNTTDGKLFMKNGAGNVIEIGYRDARVQGALSATGTGISYNTSTGVITSNATNVNTASTIVARDSSGNFSAGTITAALSGNASTATKLATPVTINGVNFDGSTNVTVTAAAGTLTGTALPSAVTSAPGITGLGTLANLTVTNTIQGNAATATKLKTPVLINGLSFDGSSNITITSDNITGGSGNQYYSNGLVRSYLSGGYDGDIIPDANNTRYLGSASKAWHSVYVGPGSLYIAGQQVVSSNNANIIFSADTNQNLVIAPSGTGDIDFAPSGTGNVNVKAPFVLYTGNQITSSDGNSIKFGNQIAVNNLTANTLNANLTINGNGTGNVTVTSPLSLSNSLTVAGNTTLNGNLTVTGTTTVINSAILAIADNIVTLNSNVIAGTPTMNAGIKVMRGDSNATQLLWKESDSNWEFTNDGATYYKMVGDTATQTLTNKTITAANNTISGLTNANLSGSAGITNANLANTTITIGSTTIALGGSNTNLSGLASVASTSFTGTLTGNAATASKLLAPVTINGVNFDGSANVTVKATATNALTIGTGLTGSSYDGSGAVTIGLDTTVTTTASNTQTLSNKSLLDVSTYIIDDADTTKKAVFSAGSIASGTTRTFTFPNVNGTLVTTGDTGSVTNVMLAGSITNNKLLNSTISGVALGGSLFSLSNGTGLTYTAGTSFNGSAASTLAIDTTVVAQKTDTQYIGTTAVALNRASANLALTGISAITLPGITSGSVQIIPTATAGTGTVLTLPATTGTVVTTGDSGTVTNAMLAGSIAITKLTNNSITINGNSVALGGSTTVTANLPHALTAGTGISFGSSTSFDGSVAVTVSVDNTVATTLTGTQTLTNKTLVSPSITGTASFAGSVSGAIGLVATATAGANTITLPAVTGTVVTTGDSGTVTNAMLAGSITDTKLSTITTAGKVSNSATTAASANTAGAIVARDASGNFTAGTITAALTGNVTGNVTGNADTATKLATSRNINGVAFDGSAAITVKASTTNALTIGTGLSGTSFDGSGAVTVAIDSTVATLTGSQTLTNKTLTSPTINGATIGGSLIPSTDVTYDLGDATHRFRDLYLSGSTIKLGTATLSASGTGLALGGSAVVTIGDTGTVTNTMLAGSIANSKLTNSSVTIGTTAFALGDSKTTLAGLTSVTSTGFTGALTGNASTATTLQTPRAIQGVNFDGSAAITVVTAGTGVTVSGTQVSIGQAVATTSNVTFNDLTVSGNLTVNGTTTTINATTLDVADLNITVAKNALSAAAANGAGLTVNGPGTAATFTYTSADDRWNLNKNLNVTTVYGALSGNATTATTLQTARAINGVNFDGSANITVTTAGTGISISGTTVTNSGVTSIVAGTGISINGSTGAVTVTNTITNNNQITNGAGYITGITSANVTTALGYTPYNSTNPSGYYSSGSTPSFGATSTGALTVSGAITATGEITAYFSDKRLKTNIAPIAGALDKVNAIRGVTFDPNETAIKLGIENKHQMGVIAQEVQAVAPELVTDSAFDGYLTVKYDKLTALLIEAVKELSSQVKDLQAQLKAKSI